MAKVDEATRKRVRGTADVGGQDASPGGQAVGVARHTAYT